MAKETRQKDPHIGGASIFQLLAFTLLGALCATVWRLPLPPIRPFAVVPKSTANSNATVDHVLSNTSPSTLDMSKVKILSFDPFIAHITDFVTAAERDHLLNLGAPLLTKSCIIDDSGTQIPSPGRTSSTAFLPAADPVVAAIAARAAHFQGYLSPSDVDVQITAYQPGQQYKHHYDWYPDGSRARNRVSTFFAILKSSCTDCGTEFPFVNTSSRGAWDKRWCDVIDCGAEHLTTRNVEGSALFWVNLDSKGRGRVDTLHAGLPAVGGEKVGLNVWSDVDVGEARGRGLLSGRNSHFWKPSRDFLRRYELVPPDEE